MSIISKIKEIIPANIRPFVIRGLILAVVWNLLYHLLLKPIQIPDLQLTILVQEGSVWLLNFFYDNVEKVGAGIAIEGVRSVNIAHQCNGLELIVLYIGFIFCVPSNVKKMTSYIVIGTIVIYILNIIRAALLAAMYYNDHSMKEFAHHYVFKIIIYAVVFLGWVLYMKKPKRES